MATEQWPDQAPHQQAWEQAQRELGREAPLQSQEGNAGCSFLDE